MSVIPEKGEGEAVSGPKPFAGGVFNKWLRERYATAEWDVVDCVDGTLRPFTDDPTPENYGLITVVPKSRTEGEAVSDEREVASEHLPDGVGPAVYSDSMLRLAAEAHNRALVHDMPIKSFVLLDVIARAVAAEKELAALRDGLDNLGFTVGRNPDGVDDTVASVLLVVGDLQAKVKELEAALRELVRLKDLRDFEAKARAWTRARSVLAEGSEQDDG